MYGIKIIEDKMGGNEKIKTRDRNRFFFKIRIIAKE